uniref:Uncharacterized protein n=1 Tax=Fagus sylvatica TaxID=28930 RepID=A0A2N9FBY4_FAGSY
MQVSSQRGSGGEHRSSHLGKGKAIAYALDSPSDTDEEYDAMEAPPLRANLQALSLERQLDCLVLLAVLQEHQLRFLRGDPELVRSGVRYPPQGGIRPRDMGPLIVVDTPLLTNLADHPSTSIRHCEAPQPPSSGRGGWSDFHMILARARLEYHAFLAELGFGPFLSIPYMSAPIGFERYSGCGGRVTPSARISGPEALAIMGITDPATCHGTTNVILKVKYLKQVLERELAEPPTDLRYR